MTFVPTYVALANYFLSKILEGLRYCSWIRNKFVVFGRFWHARIIKCRLQEVAALEKRLFDQNLANVRRWMANFSTYWTEIWATLVTCLKVKNWQIFALKEFIRFTCVQYLFSRSAHLQKYLFYKKLSWMLLVIIEKVSWCLLPIGIWFLVGWTVILRRFARVPLLVSTRIVRYLCIYSTCKCCLKLNDNGNNFLVGVATLRLTRFSLKLSIFCCTIGTKTIGIYAMFINIYIESLHRLQKVFLRFWGAYTGRPEKRLFSGALCVDARSGAKVKVVGTARSEGMRDMRRFARLIESNI